MNFLVFFTLFASILAAPTKPVQDSGDISVQIVGGTPTSAYPFVAQLTYAIPEGGSGLCTASFVAPNLLITAAHCTRDDTAGRYQVYQQNAKYDVVMVIRHPLFNAKVMDVQQYDIAFVITSTPYNGPLGVLRTDSTYFPRLDNLGYGLTDVKNGGSFVDARNAPPMTSISQVVDCEGLTGFSAVTCTKGVVKNQGVCFGDSGGPGLVDGKIATVASFILNACGSIGPDNLDLSVHTTIAQHADFVSLAMRMALSMGSAVTVTATETLPLFFYTETATATASACTATSTQVVTITNNNPQTKTIVSTATFTVTVGALNNAAPNSKSTSKSSAKTSVKSSAKTLKSRTTSGKLISPKATTTTKA